MLVITEAHAIGAQDLQNLAGLQRPRVTRIEPIDTVVQELIARKTPVVLVMIIDLDALHPHVPEAEMVTEEEIAAPIDTMDDEGVTRGRLTEG